MWPSLKLSVLCSTNIILNIFCSNIYKLNIIEKLTKKKHFLQEVKPFTAILGLPCLRIIILNINS